LFSVQLLQTHTHTHTGRPRVGLNPSEANFSLLLLKDIPTTNLYTKSEKLTVICRVTWARSERINLHSRQIMLLLRKDKTVGNIVGP
jgi:hypothetical protein